MTENLPEREHPQDPTRGHSGMTASTGGILLTGVGILGLLAFGLFVCWAVIIWLVGSRGAGVTAVDPGPPERRQPLTHSLQPNQAFEYQQMLAAKKEHLAGYGWVNREQGTARIPIDRTIDLIADGTLSLQGSEPTQTTAPEN